MQFPDLPFETPETPVSFHFEDSSIDLPDERLLTEWLLAVARAENKPFQELNFIFCSDEYLLRLNIEYLQHDYYTDVITFQHSDDAIHGDVYISTDRVADNAAANHISVQQELCRVMVHSVLHLAGYGDKTPEQERLMRQKENFYLNQYERLRA